MIAEVAGRRARRTDAQRPLLDLHLDVATAPVDQACRKAGQAIADVERHPGLGRGECVRDAGPGIAGAEMVEDGLVRDLAGQANVLWRDPTGRRAHERPAPVRRGPGDVRHAVRAGPGQEVTRRLPSAREDHRSTAEEGAEEDLEPTIATDVVERAPHTGAGQRTGVPDRSRQADQLMHDHLRPTARARGQENPLRGMSSGALARRGREAGTAGAGERHPGQRGRRRSIRDERVDLRRGDDEREVVDGQIGWTEHEPAGDAVELDEGQRRRQLVGGGDEDGTPAQLVKSTGEARTVNEIAERDRCLGTPQRAVGQPPGGAQGGPQRAFISGGHLRRP